MLPEATRPLFFLHIRKTAGLSVRHWLVNRFPVHATLLDCHHVASQQLDPSAYQFVTGHVGFDYVARFRTRPVCFAVLRDPVERALSAYYFFQRNSTEFLRWLEETLPPELAQQRVRLRGGRRILPRGVPRSRVRSANVARQRPDAMPAQPATRIATGAGVARGGLREPGIVRGRRPHRTPERFPGRLARHLGWEDDGSSIPHDNPTRGRPKLDEIPARARELLAEWNQLDLQLYRVASRLFQAWRPDPRLLSRPLPACPDFTFDQPIHGGGWHARREGRSRLVLLDRPGGVARSEAGGHRRVPAGSPRGARHAPPRAGGA